MFKHLKKYNETLFLMTVFLLFSGSVLFFNYGMSSRILLLKKESQKISQPLSEISQKINDITVMEKQINDDIVTFKNSQDNSGKTSTSPDNKVANSDTNTGLTSDNKLNLSQSSEELQILDKIKLYKKSLIDLNYSIQKINTDDSNGDSFSVGNLPEGSLRNSIHLSLLDISKKVNFLNSKINLKTDDLVNNFTTYSNGFEELPGIFKTSSESIKKAFDNSVLSITKEINIIQITSAVGISSLFFVLIVIIFGKLIKTDESIDIITQENSNILKSVKEGLFLISSDLFVGTQISQSTSKILEVDIKEHDNFDLILQDLVDEKTYIQAIDYIRVLLTGNIKESLVQSLNPLNEIKIKSATSKEKYLSMFFNRIKKNGQVVSLLVTIQDITKQVIISRELKEAKNLVRKEIEAILDTVSQNKANLLIFLSNMDSTIQQINSTLQNVHSGLDYRKELNHIYRLVHKIKGDASMFGFGFFYEFCHQFEELLNTLLRNENINGDIMLTVAVNLETLIQKTNIIKKIIDKSDSIDKNNQSLPETRTSTVSNQKEVAKTKEKQTSFAENVLFLVSEMNKKLNKNINIDINVNALQELPKEKQNKVQDIIVQLVRNAGVHAFNSNPNGKISLSLEKNGSTYQLVCADNGKGIDVNEIKEQIKHKYNVDDSVLVGKTDNQILGFIFKPGFSTAKENTIFGGRGVGLDLVAQTIKELSGKISLSTKVGQGTQFIIQFN